MLTVDRFLRSRVMRFLHCVNYFVLCTLILCIFSIFIILQCTEVINSWPSEFKKNHYFFKKRHILRSRTWADISAFYFYVCFLFFLSMKCYNLMSERKESRREEYLADKSNIIPNYEIICGNYVDVMMIGYLIIIIFRRFWLSVTTNTISKSRCRIKHHW